MIKTLKIMDHFFNLIKKISMEVMNYQNKRIYKNKTNSTYKDLIGVFNKIIRNYKIKYCKIKRDNPPLMTTSLPMNNYKMIKLLCVNQKKIKEVIKRTYQKVMITFNIIIIKVLKIILRLIKKTIKLYKKIIFNKMQWILVLIYKGQIYNKIIRLQVNLLINKKCSKHLIKIC